MDNKKQTFTNNFNNYENTRFDFAIATLMTLFSKGNQDVISDKIVKQLIDVQTKEDSSSAIKGLVYANENDDIDKSRIFYIQNEPEKIAYSWHMITHELVHFMGKPDKETIEAEINSGSDKSELGGTQVFNFNNNNQYGNFFNECGADIIAEMAMTTSVECRDTNPLIKSADDIIYTNNRYQNTDYDFLSTISRLMAVAMDNNFSNKSYDEMMHSGEGILDSQIQLINSETGQVLDEVPTNDYLYAMTGHGKHLENQFDKYSQDGSYREMCVFLDEKMRVLQNGENNHLNNKDKLKEQMLRIADMVNNKMYVLQNNKSITLEQKDTFIGKFNSVFNQALQEYDIGELTAEDIEKTTVSMLQSQSEIKDKSQDSDLKNNIPNLENQEFTKLTDTMPEGYSINDFGEIIRPAREEKQVKEPVYNTDNLSLKQKIAQFLQKNNTLMKLPFLEKFVDKQLKVLPPSPQERTTTGSNTRQGFLDSLSNFGEYRNLPPIQRMSDPEKLAEMRRKMEQQQSKNDNELDL